MSTSKNIKEEVENMVQKINQEISICEDLNFSKEPNEYNPFEEVRSLKVELQAANTTIEELKEENEELQREYKAWSSMYGREADELQAANKKIEEFQSFMSKLKQEVFDGKSKITGSLQAEGQRLIESLTK